MTIGAKLVRHACYGIVQITEVAVPREPFDRILPRSTARADAGPASKRLQHAVSDDAASRQASDGTGAEPSC